MLPDKLSVAPFLKLHSGGSRAFKDNKFRQLETTYSHARIFTVGELGLPGGKLAALCADL